MNTVSGHTLEGWEQPCTNTIALPDPEHNLGYYDMGYYDDDSWHHEDGTILPTNNTSIENENQTTQDEIPMFIVNAENVRRIVKDWEKEEIARLHKFLDSPPEINRPITFHFGLAGLERSNNTFDETVAPESLESLREYLIEEIIRLTELEELEEIESALTVVDKVRRSIWRFFHSWD